MAHDKFYGGFVDVVVFPTVGKMGQTAERLVNSGHLKCRKIIYIFMPPHEFVSRSTQGRLGVATGADNIPIFAKSRPQVNR